MKRYKLIDNKRNLIFNYTNFQWNLAFIIIFIMGIVVGCCIF
jgi:uncharacterized integral membrane protein